MLLVHLQMLLVEAADHCMHCFTRGGQNLNMGCHLVAVVVKLFAANENWSLIDVIG